MRERLAGFLHDLPIALDDEMTSRIWIDVTRLAVCYHLTAYDSVYLELALRLRLPLATGARL